MRHTHATLLLENGATERYVAERLGDTVEMIHETYGHVTPKMRVLVVVAPDDLRCEPCVPPDRPRQLAIRVPLLDQPLRHAVREAGRATRAGAARRQPCRPGIGEPGPRERDVRYPAAHGTGPLHLPRGR